MADPFSRTYRSKSVTDKNGNFHPPGVVRINSEPHYTCYGDTSGSGPYHFGRLLTCSDSTYRCASRGSEDFWGKGRPR